MKWIPAWLGEAYCTLYSKLGRTFSVGDVANALNVTKGKANLVLSRLARHGWLRRLGKGVYRLVEPGEVVKMIAALRGIEENLAKVPQKEYAGILRRFMDLVVTRYGERLVSAVVFGSMARGDATATSDVDLLLVIEDLPKTMWRRYAEASELKRRLYGSSEYVEAMLKGMACPVSLVLFTPDEAKGFHSIYLDMTTHALTLYDKNMFMRRILSKLSKHLEDLSSKRFTIEGKPVWVIKPDLKRGEVVVLE